jgi:MHS family proline/betaine transporter-like MFS transporter
MIISIMAAATVGIGLLPGYAVIGVFAPILLILFRMVQGLSAGAEYNGAAAFVIENAPREKKGLFGSTLIATVGLGMAAAAGTGLVSNLFLTTAQMRLRIEETDEFAGLQEAGKTSRSPLHEVFSQHKKALICLFVAASANGVCYYYALSYFPNMLQVVGGMDQTTALSISVIAQTVYCLLALAVGFLLAKINPCNLLIAGLLGFILLTLPVFWMMNTGSVALSIVGQIIWLACQALVIVSFTLLQVALFPARVRFSGSALAYSVAYLIFAGTASYVAVWMVSTFHSYYAPAFYSMAICGVAVIVLLSQLPATYRKATLNNYLHPVGSHSPGADRQTAM